MAAPHSQFTGNIGQIDIIIGFKIKFGQLRKKKSKQSILGKQKNNFLSKMFAIASLASERTKQNTFNFNTKRMRLEFFVQKSLSVMNLERNRLGLIKIQKNKQPCAKSLILKVDFFHLRARVSAVIGISCRCVKGGRKQLIVGSSWQCYRRQHRLQSVYCCFCRDFLEHNSRGQINERCVSQKFKEKNLCQKKRKVLNV